MAKRIGTKTLQLTSSPSVLGFAAVGAKKEKEGPLADYFDYLSDDSSFGEKTWEKAETLMQQKAINLALQKCGVQKEQIDFLFAGDLLNQCISSAYASREMAIPFFGLYGACSTMAESLCLAGMFVDTGLARQCLAVTSSHFCSAERQFRFPLEYGGQRTPTAQWTVTGSGCVILGREGQGPRVTHVTTGKIVDKGIKDANNMGAAMAPAAADTILAHFRDTGRKPSDYDLVITGDLGQLGHELLAELLQMEGLQLPRLADCGTLIYDLEGQDVHCGGSGCGCSGAVLCGLLLNGMMEGRWKRILFCGTGALLSPTSTQQGESIPSVCHAVAIEQERQG